MELLQQSDKGESMNRFKPLMVFTFVILFQFVTPALLEAGKQPHVVFIIADDLGFADVGYHGSDIMTPAIDTIAKEGARLERLYALPFCTPTRASIMTGRYPFRYGLQTAAIPADGKYGLDTNEYLLPEMLKKAGYRTAIVGKWHLGHADKKYWPLNRGFDYQYGPLLGEVDYYTHSAKGKRDWYENQKPLIEEGYATHLIGRTAVKVIQEHNPDLPLFLYLTFTAPHAPYQVPKEYEEKYPDIEDETRRVYAGMVTAMDDEIARVLAKLDQKGMRDDTLVIFMSDNGGNRTAMFSGESDVSELTLPASNAPYRGGKGTILEGGTRVVGAVSWPGHIKPGAIANPIHVVDFLPTIVNLAGASTNGSKPLDGVDQWPRISGASGPVRTEVVYNIEPYRAAVSNGNWKLIMKAGIPPVANLYDLSTDPAEERDLANSHQEIVAELQELILSHTNQTRPPLFFKYVLTHSDRMEKFIRPMIPE